MWTKCWASNKKRRASVFERSQIDNDDLCEVAITNEAIVEKNVNSNCDDSKLEQGEDNVNGFESNDPITEMSKETLTERNIDDFEFGPLVYSSWRWWIANSRANSQINANK